MMYATSRSTPGSSGYLQALHLGSAPYGWQQHEGEHALMWELHLSLGTDVELTPLKHAQLHCNSRTCSSAAFARRSAARPVKAG